ncbi:unnamed protein product [Schistosoma mattheei]|uniref:Uncharacterized protein n=1 Tax=Schistosoma mattheei TaxID=31246 RepID=A0A183Q6V6_9TREM|nr:unnamed protein product [Schistosoma mattheei]
MVVGLAYRDEVTELYWLEQPFLKVLPCQIGRLKSGKTKSNKPNVRRRRPSATLQLPSIPRQCEWNIEVGPPSLAEVQKAIVNLKRGRAAGPNGLAPEVFQDGGPTLAIRLTNILAKIWKLDVIPFNWSQSLIVPIYKKG